MSPRCCLRLAPGDERALINRAKEIAVSSQERNVALLLDRHTTWWRAPAPMALICWSCRISESD